MSLNPRRILFNGTTLRTRAVMWREPDVFDRATASRLSGRLNSSVPKRTREGREFRLDAPGGALRGRTSRHLEPLRGAPGGRALPGSRLGKQVLMGTG